MSDDRGADQRREPRVPLNAPVRISTIDSELDPGTGRRFFRSSRETCANVSRTGLFIRTNEPLEPGRRLLVELTLPGGEDIDAVGRVAWVRKNLAPAAERGVGVELLGATPDELARLHAWIAHRSGADGGGERRTAATEASASTARDAHATPFVPEATARASGGPGVPSDARRALLDGDSHDDDAFG
jgi:Tfp pilus assembly protein PilZ